MRPTPRLPHRPLALSLALLTAGCGTDGLGGGGSDDGGSSTSGGAPYTIGPIDTPDGGNGNTESTGDENADTSSDGRADTSSDGDTNGTDDTTSTDTDGGDTGSSGSSSDGSVEPVPCREPVASAAPATPHVMLVLDKSGSMLNTWDHDDDPKTAELTRWESLHNVVSNTIDAYDDRLDFGAMLFPSADAVAAYNASACVTEPAPEVPVSPDGQNVIDGIPAANDPSLAGGTPGENAVDTSGAYLAGLDPTLPKALIYISDGAANCGDAAMSSFELFENYDTTLPLTVASLWNDEGIPTYAVAIDPSTDASPNSADGAPDGITPWCKMDEIGEAGGRPNDEPPGMACDETSTDEGDHYTAQNELDLQAALEAIATDIVHCTIILDPVPEFPELLVVDIDDAEIPNVGDCETEDGWIYTNPAGPFDTIEMCGTACTDVFVAGSADMNYFCEPR